MLEKCGHLDLTVFHLIWVIGTCGNWKNQNLGGRFGATSQSSTFTSKIGQNGLNWQCCLAPKRPPGFSFFQLSSVPNLHFSWNPLLFGRPHFSCIISHLKLPCLMKSHFSFLTNAISKDIATSILRNQMRIKILVRLQVVLDSIV